MRPTHHSTVRFVATNATVWLVMVVILVLVPDWLEPRTGLTAARVGGWAVAGGFWVVSVEREWQSRFGPFVRFGLQTLLFVAAAVVAIAISDRARIW